MIKQLNTVPNNAQGLFISENQFDIYTIYAQCCLFGLNIIIKYKSMKENHMS